MNCVINFHHSSVNVFSFLSFFCQIVSNDVVIELASSKMRQQVSLLLFLLHVYLCVFRLVAVYRKTFNPKLQFIRSRLDDDNFCKKKTQENKTMRFPSSSRYIRTLQINSITFK